MSYGIRFIPDDGGKSTVLDGARYISNLGTVTLSTGKRQLPIKRPPSGASVMVIPRSIIKLGWPDNVQIPKTGYIKSYSVNGETLNYDYFASSSYTQGDFTGDIGVADIFSVSGSENVNSYGLRVRNGSNLMSINDRSYIGYVTYRGVININGRWAIPQSVLKMGNYVVFCRWDNRDTPLFLNRDNNSIECYGDFGNGGGSSVSGSVSNVQVVIFSCGFAPDLPASKKGIVIRNAAGEITYTSKYCPAQWDGSYYPMSGYEIFEENGGHENWVSPTGGVSQPMLPLCSIGFQRGDYVRDGRNWRFSPVLYSGFKMSGNRVTSYRAKSAEVDAPISLYPSFLEIACNLPCLNATDYF